MMNQPKMPMPGMPQQAMQGAPQPQMPGQPSSGQMPGQALPQLPGMKGAGKQQGLDPMHKLSYHMNDFLSTPQGSQLATQIQNQFPEVSNAIKNQVSVHKKVLNHFAGLSKPAAKVAANTMSPVPGMQPGS